MFHHTEKTFRNTAIIPLYVVVIASSNLEGIVTDIHAAGGTVVSSDAASAEATRMRNWIRSTFVGQPQSFFAAHDGIVPGYYHVRDKSEPNKVNIVNNISVPGAPSREVAEKIAREIAREVARCTERENVGHEGFAFAPHPGTYWRDRERNRRFFFVTSKSECEGHTHVRMVRVDNMRVYDYTYINNEQWDRMFMQVSGSSVPGNPYANSTSVVYMDRGEVRVLYDGVHAVNAEDLTDAQIDKLHDEFGKEQPGLREFLVEERARKNRLRKNARAAGLDERKVGMPRELGMGYGEECKANFTDPKAVAFRGSLDALKSKPLSDPLFANWLLGDNVSIPQYIQNFLDSAGIEANELPPQAGERYFSVVTGSTYTVIDVARKLYRESDYYVTMERDGDKHRAKFTYRDHASWLVTWRPVDDEGKARKTVQVDVDFEKFSEAARVAGEQMHRFFVAHEDSAVYDLVRIGHELDKRLPHWKEMPSTPPGRFNAYTETDLMIRALRTLARQRDNASMDLQKARREVEELKEQNKMQLAMADVRNKEIAKLKQERGGSWGPDRVETEQKRMRAMLYEYCSLFRHFFGVTRLRTHFNAFGARSLHGIPLEQYISFMRDMRTYVEKHSGFGFVAPGKSPEAD